MSGLIDKAKNVAQNKMGKDAQPGDKVEAGADNTANQEIDQGAQDVGVPQQDDQVINEAADDKINQDIPGGNN